MGREEETFVRWPRFVGERPKCEEFLLLLPFDAEEGINDSLDLYPSLSFVPWPLYTFPLKKKGKQGCQIDRKRGKAEGVLTIKAGSNCTLERKGYTHSHAKVHHKLLMTNTALIYPWTIPILWQILAIGLKFE